MLVERVLNALLALLAISVIMCIDLLFYFPGSQFIVWLAPMPFACLALVTVLELYDEGAPWVLWLTTLFWTVAFFWLLTTLPPLQWFIEAIAYDTHKSPGYWLIALIALAIAAMVNFFIWLCEPKKT